MYLPVLSITTSTCQLLPIFSDVNLQRNDKRIDSISLQIRTKVGTKQIPTQISKHQANEASHNSLKIARFSNFFPKIRFPNGVSPCDLLF